MRKNKKYISDVKNKIVEHHKIESGCKKRVKILKISIPTIRVIIYDGVLVPHKKYKKSKITRLKP